MGHKATSAPCNARLTAVTPKKNPWICGFGGTAQKLRNKLVFDAVSLPLRKMQHAMDPHMNAFMAKCLNGYSAITNDGAGRPDAALVTPVCHIRFLSRGERGLDSTKSFGYKKRRNSDAVPPRHIILFCVFCFQDVRLRPFRADRTIPFSSKCFIHAATPDAASRSTEQP